MEGCNILFDNILLRTKVDFSQTLQAEIALQTNLTEKINQVFSEFGWRVHFWGRKGSSYYWYFNGNANCIIGHSQNIAIKMLTHKEYTGVQEKIQNACLKVDDYPFGVPYETLESILNSTSVLFNNAIKSVIEDSKEINLTNVTPWIWFKGISLHIIASPELTDDITKEVYKKFENELHYIEEYDKILNPNMEKRIIISKSEEIHAIEIKLRFPRGYDYLLALNSFSGELLKRYYINQYKGINRILKKMFDLARIGEYQQAFSYLLEEEQKVPFDENKVRKISKLRSSLEIFVEYKQLKEQSTAFLSLEEIKRKKKLESELKKSGFFSMYKTALRDLRVFEFKVSELMEVINRI